MDRNIDTETDCDNDTDIATEKEKSRDNKYTVLDIQRSRQISI